LRASFVAGASCGPALQVPAVPEGAAMASCEHAYDLVRMLGESGWKARPRSGGAQVLHRVLPVGFGAVCGLASASAIPGGPAGQAARDDVLLLARVPVRQPQPQDASGELRSRQVPPALGRGCLKV